MKQKITILKLVGVAGILILGILISTVRSQQDIPQIESPVTIKDDNTSTNETTPALDYGPTNNYTSRRSDTTTASLTHTTNTPEQPKPISPTNSPKQSEIRQSITKEYIYYPLLTADDPTYSTNWAVRQVNAPTAWDISTGSTETTIAVIDTGFALNHEDLVDRWALNNQEIGTTVLGDYCWTGVETSKQTNDCDDDSNGYIDDWRGWNFSLGDNNVMTGRTNQNGDGVYHGTEVAGLAGSSGNNALGTTTISWNTKIMPLQAMSDDGPGYTSDIVAAIYYAVDNGADVINMSLGGFDYDEALEMATDYAYTHDVLVVAAAGNCGIPGDTDCAPLPTGAMLYPALNNNVISVGATTSTSERAGFSSYGPDLDIVAPGAGTIVSPTWMPGNGTSLYVTSVYGTSFASPQVASLVALIKSIRPDSSANDIKALLLATATKPSSMNGGFFSDELGHGIINADTALAVAQSLNTTTLAPEIRQVGGVKSEHSFKSTDTVGNGCKTDAPVYCAIWFRDTNLGRERYLPYKMTDLTGQAGWTWPGVLLTSGNWRSRAISGDYLSPIPYLLLKK